MLRIYYNSTEVMITKRNIYVNTLFKIRKKQENAATFSHFHLPVTGMLILKSLTNCYIPRLHVLMPCIHAERKKHAGKYCKSLMPFHIPVSLPWPFSVLLETVFQILPVLFSLRGRNKIIQQRNHYTHSDDVDPVDVKRPVLQKVRKPLRGKHGSRSDNKHDNKFSSRHHMGTSLNRNIITWVPARHNYGGNEHSTRLLCIRLQTENKKATTPTKDSGCFSD